MMYKLIRRWRMSKKIGNEGEEEKQDGSGSKREGMRRIRKEGGRGKQKRIAGGINQGKTIAVSSAKKDLCTCFVCTCSIVYKIVCKIDAGSLEKVYHRKQRQMECSSLYIDLFEGGGGGENKTELKVEKRKKKNRFE